MSRDAARLHSHIALNYRRTAMAKEESRRWWTIVKTAPDREGMVSTALATRQ